MSNPALNETTKKENDLTRSSSINETLNETIEQDCLPESPSGHEALNKTIQQEDDLPGSSSVLPTLTGTIDQNILPGSSSKRDSLSKTVEQVDHLPELISLQETLCETIQEEDDFRDSSDVQVVLDEFIANEDALPGSSYVRDVDSDLGVTDIVRVSDKHETLPRASVVESPFVRTALSFTGLKMRRERIPDRPDNSVSLWSFLKNCVGKELSKVPWPINFSEPLSILQRMVEDFEYAYLLDHAAALDDPCEKLAYVAVFTISTYSSADTRITKPFNPLLGETYECDRTADLGWKVISEQVSHHPPITALHCEGLRWKCWQEYSTATKFRGKYLEIKPLGISHLEFDNGSHCTWSKVKTTIYNLVIGKLWVDINGIVELIDHSEGTKCTLTYYPHSYFNSEQYRTVKGFVKDKEGVVRWIIKGHWNDKLEMAAVVSVEGTDKSPVYETGPFQTVWERIPPPEGSDKYYNMSLLACQLNEPEGGVAPTDSRNRPDQRLMEEGNWDEANATKVRLEEKQREKRREREIQEAEAKSKGEELPPYEPVWFRKEVDPLTNEEIYLSTGEYWDCKKRGDWSKCPDIYL